MTKQVTNSSLGLNILIVIITCLCVIAGMSIFWFQEYRYSLPTPVPENHKPVPLGSSVSLFTGQSFNFSFLHFYNPDCPCSRFNAAHVRSIINSHGDSVKAFIVVPSFKDKQKAKEEFGEVLEIITDQDGEIAKACGVYSTPQAVVIDNQGKLFYRGNYNQARYCAVAATNYAELALLSMINGSRPPMFDLYATTPYGCELPSNKVKGIIKF